jgi:hypothetical protein
MVWKYNGRIIGEGKPWKDDNGVQHPSNWYIWPSDHKKAIGMTEVIYEAKPDSRLYTWSYNANGTVNKTAKNLTEVKTALKAEVSNQQKSILAQTDWYVIRKSDKGTAIPNTIQTYRDAVRTKGDSMKTSIDNAADTNAIAALFIAIDKGGKKTGILYEWPVLEE